MDKILIAHSKANGYALVWATPPHYRVGYGTKMFYCTEYGAVDAMNKIAHRRNEAFDIVRLDGSIIHLPKGKR